MSIKVLAIFGSPRKGGNTDTMLEAAIEGVLEMEPEAEVERVRADSVDVAPCNSCGDCTTTGICTIEDDMTDIYGKLDRADILLASSPVYFMGVTGQLKIMIDRCQCVWIKNFELSKEPGRHRMAGFLSASGQVLERNFPGLDNTMLAWFTSLGFIYKEKLFIEDMDRYDSVKRSPRSMGKARDLGRRLVGSFKDGK